MWRIPLDRSRRSGGTVSGTTIPAGDDAYDGGWWQVECTNNITGCKSESSDPVFANIKPQIIIPPAESNTPVCQGEQLNLRAHFFEGATYRWTGPNGFGSNEQNPSIPNCDVPHDGAYQLEVTINGCVYGAAPDHDVVIMPRPTVTVGDMNVECAYGIYDITIPISTQTGTPPYLYHWVGPNNFYSVDREPTLPNVWSADEGSYTVLVTDANNCISEPVTAVVGVSDAPPTPTIEPIEQLCEGDLMELVVQEYKGETVFFEWNTPQGLLTTNIPSLIESSSTISSDAGQYNVRVYVDGCWTLPSAETEVEVFENPVNPAPASSYSLNPMCEGGVLTLLATGNPTFDYQWTGPDGFSSTEQNPSINKATQANNGHYTVKVTNNICENIGTIELTGILPIPETPMLTADEKLCEGEVMELSTYEYAGNTVTYDWTTPVGTAQSTVASYIIPSAALTQTGNYSVQVTVDGCPSLWSPEKYVKVDATPVNPNPVIDYSLAPSYCAGGTLSITIDGNATDVYTWSGPNGFVATTQNIAIPNADVTDNGSYLVKVANGDCTNEAAASINAIKPYPETPFVSQPEGVCEGEFINLSTSSYNGSVVNFNWITPTGGKVTTSPGLIVNPATVADEGYYSLWVDVDGCVSLQSPSTYIAVNEIPAAPAPIYTYSLTPACNGGDITLIASGNPSHEYKWTGPNAFFAVGQVVVVKNASEISNGAYTVEVTNGTCKNSGTVSVNGINSIPETPEISSIPALCENQRMVLKTQAYYSQNVDYEWNTPNGQVITSVPQLVINSVALTDNGNYSVQINSNGCISDVSGNIYVEVNKIPTIDATVAGAVCEGANIQLNGLTTDAGVTFQWAGPNGFVSNQQNPVINVATINNSGDYTATISKGVCTSSDLISVTVNPEPATPVLTSNSPICKGNPLTISTITSGTIRWTAPNGTVTTSASPLVIPSANALYLAGSWKIQAVNASGCVSDYSEPKTVIINEIPEALPSNSSPVCAGADVTLYGNTLQNAQYEWYDDNAGLPNNRVSTEKDLTIKGLASGNYVYHLVTVVNGCSSPAVSTNVSVNSIVAAPNITTAAAVCESGNIVLKTTTNADKYYWTGANGFNSNLREPAVISNVNTSHSGDYKLKVEINGCISVETVAAVTVNPKPEKPVITTNSPVCRGEDIVLKTISTSTSYTWIAPNGSKIIGASSIGIASNSAVYGNGSWKLQLSNALACASEVSEPIAVIVNEVPISIPLNSSPACTNTDVQLFGNSVPNAAYRWYTDNSGSLGTLISTEQNPILTNLADGTHKYHLVISANGCISVPQSTDVMINSVLAAPQLPADFSVCEGDEIILTTPTKADKYRWTGANGFTSDLQYPAAIVASISNAGDYTLAIEIDGCGSASTTVKVVVNPKPQKPVITSNSFICNGSDLILQTGSIGTKFSWIGPDGDSPMVMSNPALTTATNSTTITSTNIAYKAGLWQVMYENAFGCVSDISEPISVTINTIPTAELSSNSPVCPNESIELSASGSATNTYLWYENGNLVATTQNPTIISPAIGVHTFNLSVQSGSCVSPMLQTVVTVNDIPQITAPDVTLNCATGNTNLMLNISVTGGSSPYHYTWLGPNGFASTQEDPILVRASAKDAGTYLVTVSDYFGCQSVTESVTVEISNVVSVPDISIAEPLCEGSDLELFTTSSYVGSAVMYMWTTPTGTVTTSIPQLSVSNVDLNDGGFYSLHVNVDGCQSPESVNRKVIVTAIPQVTLGGNSVLCEKNKLQLTATPTVSGNYSYQWEGPNGYTSNQQNPSILNVTPDYSGDYTVKVISENGICSSLANLSVLVNAKPVTPVITGETAICDGENLILRTIASASKYTWLAPDGTSTIASSSINILQTSNLYQDGAWQLFVEDANGCISDISYPFDVIINEIPLSLPMNGGDVCSGKPIQLYGNTISNAVYMWYGNSGDLVSMEQNPVVAGLADGNYTYWLKTTVLGCTSPAASTQLAVNAKLQAPAMPANFTVCEGGIIEIIPVVEADKYEWTGPNSYYSTSKNPPVITNSQLVNAGRYYLSVEIDGCQSLSTYMTINVSPKPSKPSILNNAPLCENEALVLKTYAGASQYRWLSPDGSEIIGTSSDNEISIPITSTYYQAGNWRVVTTNANGCVSDISENSLIEIHPIPMSIAGTSQNICAATTVQLSANLIKDADYEWYNSKGELIATEQKPVLSDLSVGIHTFELKIYAEGCYSNSAFTTVTVNEIPKISLSDVQLDCSAGDVDIILTANVTGGATPYIYKWTGPNNFVSSNSQPVLANAVAADAGIYNLIVEDAKGCKSLSVSNIVDISNAVVTPKLATTAPYCEGEVLELSVDGYTGNYVRYHWQTPKGVFSTSEPSKILTNLSSDYTGTYGVNVEVDGCTSLMSQLIYIEINKIPALPDIQANALTLCESDKLILSTTAQADKYLWIGPGGFTSNKKNPEPIQPVTLNNKGDYQLQVETKGCVSPIQIVNININEQPNTPVVITNSPICYGDAIQLKTEYVATSYQWVGPDGDSEKLFGNQPDETLLWTVSSQTTIPSTTAERYDAGLWRVRIQNEKGCFSKLSEPVNVIINPIPRAIAKNSSPVCSGHDVTLIADEVVGAEYHWFNDNSPKELISTNKNETVKGLTDGTHTFYLQTELNGCVSELIPTQAVINNILPAPNMNGNFVVCQASELILSTTTYADSYTWRGPNGFEASVQNPPAIRNVSSLHAGTYTLSIVRSGCASEVKLTEVSVKPKPEVPILKTNSPVCEGSSLVLNTNTIADTYVWTLPDGEKVTTTSGILSFETADMANNGFYSLSIGTNGCQSDASPINEVVINQIPLDNAYAGEDFVVCASDREVRLTAKNPKYTGLWTSPDNVLIVSPEDPNSIITNLQEGMAYHFVWTISNGACANFSTDELIVATSKMPVANTDELETYANKTLEGIDLTINDEVYQQGTHLSIVANPLQAMVNVNSDYTVDYMPNYDFLGNDVFTYRLCLDACPTMCDTANVFVKVGTEIFIPDIITPNNDGINDNFVIQGIENYPQNEVYIYNRWGAEVYHSVDYKNDWKGTYKEEDLPDGTYFFILLNRENGEAVFKGYFTLYR